MTIKTCVSPKGKFNYGIHRPAFHVENLRQADNTQSLGMFSDGRPCENSPNFPQNDVHIADADIIFEIPNALPFKGTTYIKKKWADEKKDNLSSICLPPKPSFSWNQTLKEWANQSQIDSTETQQLWHHLPQAVQLTIASTSSDPTDLTQLAHQVCEFTLDENSVPVGLKYDSGSGRPIIHDHVIFETLANNPYLPDNYKVAMVLRPGVQGKSPIVGEFSDDTTHVFEYLRANSYIPWGHYAANMADDSIRYDIQQVTLDDIIGMRHLFYQRTYVRLCQQLEIPVSFHRKTIPPDELESLRLKIKKQLKHDPELPFNSNLWGWNFGFDYSPNHYRLHASHQQVHQQYAMIPNQVPTNQGSKMQSFACGDLVADFIHAYRQCHGTGFFDDYTRAIQNNQRMDESDKNPKELIIYSDDHIMIYVPKAQTSQWEIQIMPTHATGNVLEADSNMRFALDRGIYMTAKILSALNARLVTHIEYASRLSGSPTDQRLIIVFLPRLPESPGAFSEAQLRWINGHYPEDFAAACRNQLETIF